MNGQYFRNFFIYSELILLPQIDSVIRKCGFALCNLKHIRDFIYKHIYIDEHASTILLCSKKGNFKKLVSLYKYLI